MSIICTPETPCASDSCTCAYPPRHSRSRFPLEEIPGRNGTSGRQSLACLCCFLTACPPASQPTPPEKPTLPRVQAKCVTDLTSDWEVVRVIKVCTTKVPGNNCCVCMFPEHAGNKQLSSAHLQKVVSSLERLHFKSIQDHSSRAAA